MLIYESSTHLSRLKCLSGKDFPKQYKSINHKLLARPPPVQTKKIEKDKTCESLITISSHSGTHVDAPAHFFKDGKKIGDLSKFLNDAEVIKQVLKNLDRSVWDNLPEIKKIIVDENNNGNHIKSIAPGGIRTYEKVTGSKWKFVKDEGI